MYRFKVNTMVCGGCGAAVTRALQAADAKAQIKTFPETRQVEIESTLSSEQLLAVLDQAGYPAEAQ
jgi:copper chaperone